MTTHTPLTLDTLAEPRRVLLKTLKTLGKASASTLAKQLGLTREATRQQLVLLQQLGLIDAETQQRESAGRPTLLFFLTTSGEHFFPKHYDQLSLLLIDTVADTWGEKQLTQLLSTITDKQVAQWQQKLVGLSIKQRLLALKDFYFANDPFTEVIEDKAGLWFVEKNCPFLNLATQRPSLCSITTSTLSRLLGVKVIREKRFQNGDGQCAFRILSDHTIDSQFRFNLEEH